MTENVDLIWRALDRVPGARREVEKLAQPLRALARESDLFGAAIILVSEELLAAQPQPEVTP